MSTIDEIRALLKLARTDDRYIYRRYEINEQLRALIKTLDPAEVDALLAITDDPEESDFRETIISELHDIPSPKIIPYLHRVVQNKDEDPTVRWEVIEDLGMMKDVTVLPLLVKILGDIYEYDTVREFAAGALANIGDPAGGKILIKVIVEEAGMLFHGDVVSAATESLRELCEISPETVQNVVETLATPELSERAKYDLIRALVDVNHPLAFKTLAEYAASPVNDIRDYAVFGLSRMAHTRDEVILNALRAALNDPDEDIRQQAKDALDELDAKGD